MNIKGIVVSGTRKGSYFVSQKVYSDQFQQKLGFKPFPGTLNIEIGGETLKQIDQIPEEKKGIIQGKEGFGDVNFIKAALNEIDGALLFPVKTEHPRDILEFIAAVNLRKSLKLNDGDLVTLKVKSDENNETEEKIDIDAKIMD